jgi:hypothetical protein
VIELPHEWQRRGAGHKGEKHGIYRRHIERRQGRSSGSFRPIQGVSTI